MEELNKLEAWLKENGYKYIRRRRGDILDDIEWGEQIIVFENETRAWDVICGYGSYGYKAGLLEVMGDTVVRGDDSVEGWLTADKIISRLKENKTNEQIYRGKCFR